MLAAAVLCACASKSSEKRAPQKVSGEWVVAQVVVDPNLPENQAIARESPEGYEWLTGLLIQQTVGRKYVFKPDGAFEKFVPYDSSFVAGSWRQDGDSLRIAYADGDVERREAYRIEFVGDSTLTLLSHDKLTVKYVFSRPVVP
ncbi:MAG: hypothetical protein RMM53_12305 [Bacteroidia bacterium]|nr:hypothetical protein [Bacteroidia bacterium]MDW8334988.1 hypothetical protein [Bacteroidia bacterium]